MDQKEHQNWDRIGSHNQLFPGKYGVEIRNLSVNRHHSLVGQNFSWFRLAGHEFDEQRAGTSEVQFEKYALRLNASDFASRSKAKAKPQRRDSASSSTRTSLIGERTLTDVEPGAYSISDYEVSKKLIYLLRHSQKVHREEDGAVHFWRIKDHLQDHFVFCHHWSDEKWKRIIGRRRRIKEKISVLF